MAHAEEPLRDAQHGVPDHAAEPGRQRPMTAMRQAGRERGHEHRAEEPEQDAQPLAAERAMAEQPIAPHRDRQEQSERAQPEELHHQIGGDGAGPSEQIVHRRIGGVAQRGVLHRPGGERERRHHRQTDERNAAGLAQPALEQRAELAGKQRHSVKAAVEHRHRVFLPQPSTATRRCSASAVISLFCTMATRM